MKKILSFILIICLIISQTGCSAKNEQKGGSYVMGEDWLLNTYCYIKILDEGNRGEAIDGAFKLAREYENRLSRTIDSSEISSGNYSDETRKLVDLALMFEEETDGRFCIHLGSVSDLWDFGGSKGGPFLPDPAEIEEALEKQTVDLGAIAKGYIADRVAEYLKAEGIQSAIISLGGNIVCVGEKPDGSLWQVGIEKPFSSNDKPLETREQAGMLSVGPDSSAVTSGIYERCFTSEDGIFYHHILDPGTGYPCESDVVSATIVGPSSCICDALATISVLLGCEEAGNFISKYNSASAGSGSSYEYLFILSTGEIIESPGISFSE